FFSELVPPVVYFRRNGRTPVAGFKEKAPTRRGFKWLRGTDLNCRPLGYEPNELPDCSTPRYIFSSILDCLESSWAKCPGRNLQIAECYHSSVVFQGARPS